MNTDKHGWKNGLLESWSVGKSTLFQYSILPTGFLSVRDKNKK
jgi:hypothetical protein